MCTHFTPSTAILIDVLWGTFSIGGLFHLERCQGLLLYPLRTLSVPSAGVTEYGPSFSGWTLDLLGFRRTLLLYHFICCYLFTLWHYSDIKWNIGLLENVWRLWRSLKELLSGFRTIIVIATINWHDFFPEASLTSQTSHLIAPMTSCGFVFVRAHVIAWSLLAHLFVCFNCERGSLSVLFNGISLVLVIDWDIFFPQ